MTMEIIKDKSRIDSLQKKFERILIESCDKPRKPYRIEVDTQAYKGEHDVYYSKKLNIWFLFDKAEKSGTDKPNRYWNVFGLGKPNEKGSNRPSCEINFSFKGRLNEGSGVFIKDGKRILVCHTGRMGGG